MTGKDKESETTKLSGDRNTNLLLLLWAVIIITVSNEVRQTCKCRQEYTFIIIIMGTNNNNFIRKGTRKENNYYYYRQRKRTEQDAGTRKFNLGLERFSACMIFSVLVFLFLIYCTVLD